MASQVDVPWTKTLVLMRHAKSAYPPGVADINRPLNGRGRMDAPVAGRWIETNLGVPDLVVRSPANRVRQTWELASGEWSRQPSSITVDERIYEASVQDLLAVIAGLPEANESALIIGHNPGLEDTVRVLAHTANTEAAEVLAQKFATAAIAVVKFAGSWSDTPPGFLEYCVIPRG